MLRLSSESQPMDRESEPNTTNKLEALRQEELNRYQAIDSQSQAVLDGLTELAAHLCQTPVALMTFVGDRQYFKSRFGTDLTEAPLEAGFCPLVVAKQSSLIIPDTAADSIYASHPTVLAGVRFYAGMPLITSEGCLLGTICVLDFTPRQLTTRQIQGLELLATQVVAQLEQMLMLRKSRQTERALVKVTQSIDAATGKAFFRNLVASLASIFEVDCAYIAKLGENSQTMRTIALWHSGQILENIEYDISVSPCRAVIAQKQLCCYPSGAQSLFDPDKWLVAEKIDSYAAIPLIDSTGTTLGILGISDRKPLVNVPLVELLLRLLATRTARELERQEIEAIKHESEARLRFVLDSSQIGEWDLDLTTEPYIGQRSLKHDEIFGYNSLLRQWTYEIFLQHVHPQDRAFVDEKFQNTLANYENLGCEFRIIRLDGIIRWIWAQGSVYRNLNGAPVRLLGIAIDITERKEAEAALRESEWRFRQVVESKVFGVLFGDTSGNIHYANEYILNLLGYSAQEMLSGSLRWNSLTPPEFARLDASAIAQLRKEGVCQPYEKAYIHQDGRQIPVLVTAALLEQPFNQQQEAVAFILDLSELKRTREERDRFFSLSLDMLAIANFDGYFTHLNPSWSKTLGWTEAELMAKPFLEFVHPQDVGKTLAEVQKLNRGRETIQFENRYLTKYGSYRWLAWTSTPLIEQNVVYAVARDITERKAVEQERERLLIQEQSAREAAEQANRIKDEFLAVVSHELRTPLNPILGWSKLLQQGRLNPTRAAEAIATIERNAKLQVQLVDDLLDISRILRGKLALTVAPVSLDTVISAAIETVRLAAEAKSLEIQVNYPASPITVNGDTGRLQQIVWNLLSNAVKFTPTGGQVEIELSQVGDSAQLRVKDTGKGIHPDFLAHVFENFRQEDAATTRKFGGLGLGLAIVKQIVELHGGIVSVDSAGEGLGSTFTVQIPLAAPEMDV